LFVLEIVAQDGDLLQATLQSDSFLFLQKNKNIFSIFMLHVYREKFSNNFLLDFNFTLKINAQLNGR
jgi:hypothetical protein